MKHSTARYLAACVAVAILAGTTPAYAHSQLESATPVIDAQLKVSPRSIALTFNEPVGVAAKGVQLLDAAGKQIAASGVAKAATVKFSTPKLKPGRYVVRWRVTSADGHIIVASYAFAVATATKQGKAFSFELNDAEGKVTSSIDANLPGLRTLGIELAGLEGTLELKHPSFGAPMLWPMKVSGSKLIATGMLPASGTWTVTARVRTGQFDERVLTGKLRIVV